VAIALDLEQLQPRLAAGSLPAHHEEEDRVRRPLSRGPVNCGSLLKHVQLWNRPSLRSSVLPD
jgi:hypothetical protein